VVHREIQLSNLERKPKIRLIELADRSYLSLIIVHT
jgi:hypothetical protein